MDRLDILLRKKRTLQLSSHSVHPSISDFVPVVSEQDETLEKDHIQDCEKISASADRKEAHQKS